MSRKAVYGQTAAERRAPARLGKAVSVLLSLVLCSWFVPAAAIPSVALAAGSTQASTYSMSDVASGAEEPLAGDIVTIKNADELVSFRTYVGTGGSGIGTSGHVMKDITVVLTDDIDLKDACHPRTGSGRDYQQWGGSEYMEEVSWTPIGGSNAQSAFCGIFDGRGHTIKNLYISTSTSQQGLFKSLGNSSVGNHAEVKNLTLQGALKYEGTSPAQIGALVATVNGNTDIMNVRNEATVSAKNNGSGTVAGAAGIAYNLSGGNINLYRCVNAGDIDANGKGGIGGIAYTTGSAQTAKMSIVDCYNTGMLAAVSTCGGILAYPQNMTKTISSCYSTTAAVFSTTATWKNATVTNAYSKGTDGDDTYTEYVLDGGEAKQVAGCAALTAALNADANSSGTWKEGKDWPVLGWESGAPWFEADLDEQIAYVDAADTTALSVDAKLPLGGLLGHAGTLSYQWQRNVSGAGWQDVSGATGTSLDVGSALLSAGESVMFRCVVTNTFDQIAVTANSAAAQIVLRSSTEAATPAFDAAETLTTTPSVLKGQSVAVATKVATEGAGVGDLAYQWYRCDGEDYSGAVAVANASGVVADDGKISLAGTTVAPNVGANYLFCKVTNTFEGAKLAEANSPVIVVNVSDSVTIGDADAFKDFRDTVNGSSGKTRFNYSGVTVNLDADIDLESAEWTPIGSSTTASFAGVFDGHGHSIENLKCTSGAYRGLFGYVVGTAAIRAGVKNLSVSGAVSGTSNMGGVCAHAGYADFQRVVNKATLNNTTSGTTAQHTGGIVGNVASDTTFTECANTASITTASRGALAGTSGTGGIVGYTSASTIDRCYNTGAIENTGTTTSYANVGGIAGSAAAAVKFSNCYNAGELSSNVEDDRIGAMVGKATTNLAACPAYEMTACYSGTANTPLAGWTSVNTTKLSNCFELTTTAGTYKSATDSTTLDATALLEALNASAGAWVVGEDAPELLWASGAPVITTDLSTELRYLDAADSAELRIVAGKPAEGHGSSAGDVISYQWQQSADGTTFTDMEGQTAATLTVQASDLTAGAKSWFRCVATNTGEDVCGGSASATSSAAEFYVRTSKPAAQPRFESTLGEVTVPVGSSAFTGALRVATEPASADELVGDQTFQWYSCASADKKDAVELAGSKGSVDAQGAIQMPDISGLTTAVGDSYIFVEVTNTAEDTKTSRAQSPVIAVHTVDSYRVSSASDLVLIAQECNKGTTFDGVTFTLASDIDLSEDDGAAWHADSKWMAIGNTYNSGNVGLWKVFSGTFDGAGHAVRGFDKDRMASTTQGPTASTASMFGFLSGATIKDLTVEGSTCGCAGLAYMAVPYAGKRATTIAGCTNKVEMPAANYSSAGGILACLAISTTVAHQGVVIEGCVNEADITATYSGDTRCGGIAGDLSASEDFEVTVRNCVNKGDITRTGNQAYHLGGIAGVIGGYTPSATSKYVTFATLENCENAGTVTTQSTYKGSTSGVSNAAGGIASAATLVNASGLVNTGDVGSAKLYCVVGGIFGELAGGVGSTLSSSTATKGSLTDAINTGAVSGGLPYSATSYFNQASGGIVGYANMAEGAAGLARCANHGAVGASGAYSVGGVVGRAGALQMTDCYNSATVTGDAYVAGLVGNSLGANGQAGPISWLTRCYNVGDVASTAATSSAVSGGNVECDKVYFVDTSAVGSSQTEYGTAMTLEQMRAADFVSTLNGTNKTWVASKSYYADGAPLLSIELDEQDGLYPAVSLHEASLGELQGGTAKIFPTGPVAPGTTIALATTPDSGKSVLGDPTATYKAGEEDVAVPVTFVDVNSYTFKMPAANTLVAAKFGNEVTATLATTESTYDKTSKVLDLEVKAGEQALVAGDDYKVVVRDSAGAVVSDIVNAGDYAITVDGTGAYGGHFEFTYTVKPVELVVSGFSMNDKTYNGTTDAAGKVTGTNANARLTGATFGDGDENTGILAGDTVYATAASGSFADKNVACDEDGNAIAKPVTLKSVTLGGADAANYTVDIAASQAKCVDAEGASTLQATIKKRTWGANSGTYAMTGLRLLKWEKVYDGTTDFDGVFFDDAEVATIDAGNIASYGVIKGDIVVLESLKAQLASADVANGVKLNLSDPVLGGRDAGNYTPIATLFNPYSSWTIDIVQAPLKITPKTGQGKEYGADDPELEADLVGLVGKEKPVVSGSLTRAEGEDVGSYDIERGTYDVADQTAEPEEGATAFKLSNYKVSFADDVKFDIAPAKLVVTPDAGQSYAFGSEDQVLTYTVSGAKNGEEPKLSGKLAVDLGEGTAQPNEAYPIVIGDLALVDSDGFKASNYELGLAQDVVTATVTTVPTSVELSDTSKVYDARPAAVPELKASSNAVPVWTWYAGEDATGAPLDGAPVAAGTYTAKAALPAVDGYLAAEATQTVTIAKAPLVVTAGNLSVNAHQTPAYTASYQGFAEGEDASVLGGTLKFACGYDAKANKNASFEIVPSGLSADNYDISYVSGTLTVKAVAETGGSVTAGDGVSYQLAADGSATATGSKTASAATIPAEVVDANGFKHPVTAVSAGAFKGNTKLKSVAIGANVKTIGADAFSGCTSLSKVTGAANVVAIQKNAFAKCKKLKSITLSSKKLTTVAAGAFASCKALQKVTIASAVLSSIGSKAFNGDSKLTSVSIAKTTKLKTVKNAFKGAGKNKGKKLTVKVKKSKKKAYKKLIVKKGGNKKLKVK